MSTAWGRLSDKLVGQAIEKRVPLIGQFELTSRCNLQCRMCYICNSPNDSASISSELSAKEWVSLIEKARDAGMLYLLFTGGEVFIRQDFRTIYEEASMMGLNIVFYTNGTLITPDKAGWLGRIPPSRAEVTLYGASNETYHRVCGNPQGFDEAIRGIDLLLSQGIALKIRTTVVKGNSGDFDKIAEIANSRGVELGIVDYISPRRDDCRKYPEGERLSPKELADYLKHVDSYFENNDKPETGCLEENGKLSDNKNLDKPLAAVSASAENAFFCEAGKCAFWVTWDGRMTPCGLMDQPAVFPIKDGFKTSWSKLMKACLDIPVCTECASCSLNSKCVCCPARLKNETGFYNKPAKYLCELAGLM